MKNIIKKSSLCLGVLILVCAFVYADTSVSDLGVYSPLFEGDLTCTSCVSDTDINQTSVQKRVSSFCSAGSSIRQVNEDGTVVCETDDEGISSCSVCNNDFLQLIGGEITGIVHFDDNSGDSPSLYFEDGDSSYDAYLRYDSGSGLDIMSDEGVYIYAYNTGNDVRIWSDDDDVYIDADSWIKLDTLSSGGIDFEVGNLGCNIDDDGDINCDGNKNARIYVEELDQFLYTHAVESSTVDFYERGVSELKGNSLVVEVSKNFQYVISRNKELMVFVTPLDPCILYVSDSKWDSFTVSSMEGQNSCKFNWIAYAYRDTYEDIKMMTAGKQFTDEERTMIKEYKDKMDPEGFNDKIMHENKLAKRDVNEEERASGIIGFLGGIF